MAQSNLTVRTLALATVALVLACGRAVHAMQQQKAAAEKTAAPAPSPAIRVVPAGSGHSTIATYSNNAGGRSSSSGSARVATFTASGRGAGSSIVTFQGDKLARQSSANSQQRRPQPQQTAAKNRKPGGGILPSKGDAPVISVRRVIPGQAQPAPAETLIAPAKEVTTQVVTAAPREQKPALRNAFAGISTPRAASESIGPASTAYAHASRR